MFEIVINYWPGLLRGLGQTLAICTAVWAISVPAGSLVGLFAFTMPKSAGVIVRICAFFLGSIPPLILLFWFHFPLQAILGVRIDPVWTIILTLTVVDIFAVAEITRWAYSRVPQSLRYLGWVSGLRRSQIFMEIELPTLIRHASAPILFSQIVVLHASLFGSLISVEELFRVGQRINAVEYQPVEVYSVVGLMFLLITIPLNLISFWVSRRSGGNSQ